MEEHLGNGNHQVIDLDLDIRGYFDAIPHERLLSLVKQRISDSKLLTLSWRAVTAYSRLCFSFTFSISSVRDDQRV